MYVGNDFSPQNPSETNTLDFNFVRDLGAGETILSSLWFCTVHPMSDLPDLAPEAKLIGSAQISGTRSLQKVGNLLPGVLYIVECTTLTSTGNKPSYWSHIRGLSVGVG